MCPIGKEKEVEGMWGKLKKVPAVIIVDAEVAGSVHKEELREWAEGIERVFEALQGEGKESNSLPYCACWADSFFPRARSQPTGGAARVEGGTRGEKQ